MSTLLLIYIYIYIIMHNNMDRLYFRQIIKESQILGKSGFAYEMNLLIRPDIFPMSFLNSTTLWDRHNSVEGHILSMVLICCLWSAITRSTPLVKLWGWIEQIKEGWMVFYYHNVSRTTCFMNSNAFLLQIIACDCISSNRYYSLFRW